MIVSCNENPAKQTQLLCKIAQSYRCDRPCMASVIFSTRVGEGISSDPCSLLGNCGYATFSLIPSIDMVMSDAYEVQAPF